MQAAVAPHTDGAIQMVPNCSITSAGDAVLCRGAGAKGGAGGAAAGAEVAGGG